MHYIPSLKTTAAKPSSQSLDMSALKGQLSAADSLRVDPRRKPAMTRVMAQLRRFGYDLKDTETVDPFRLDQVLANSEADTTSRIALKPRRRWPPARRRQCCRWL
jgi:hypothetical protein